MLRIAHISDLHILSPLGAEWRRVLFNKRMTAYANVIEVWVFDPATLTVGPRRFSQTRAPS